jgi:hypothetical protein
MSAPLEPPGRHSYFGESCSTDLTDVITNSGFGADIEIVGAARGKSLR